MQAVTGALTHRDLLTAIDQQGFTATLQLSLCSRTTIVLADEITLKSRSLLHEYQLVGRHLPTEKEPTPKLFRMRLFATNEVIAKSRFWYFMRKLKKVKKVNGEIV
ncbi:60S ribosomal protein L20, partial [Mortierella alpina]